MIIFEESVEDYPGNNQSKFTFPLKLIKKFKKIGNNRRERIPHSDRRTSATHALKVAGRAKQHLVILKQQAVRVERAEGKRGERRESRRIPNTQSPAQSVRGLLRSRGRKDVEGEAARLPAELPWLTILVVSRQGKMQGQRETIIWHIKIAQQ